MVNEIPKSTIICENLEEWKIEQEKNIPVDQLVEELGTKAAVIYNSDKRRNKPSLSKFLSGLKSELQKKGIEDLAIYQIIKYTKDGANK